MSSNCVEEVHCEALATAAACSEIVSFVLRFCIIALFCKAWERPRQVLQMAVPVASSPFVHCSKDWSSLTYTPAPNLTIIFGLAQGTKKPPPRPEDFHVNPQLEVQLSSGQQNHTNPGLYKSRPYCVQAAEHRLWDMREISTGAAGSDSCVYSKIQMPINNWNW